MSYPAEQSPNLTPEFSDQGKKTVLLSGKDPELKRQEIRAYFHKTCFLYERLFDCLVSEQAYYRKASPLRHPLIFYYGHTAVFFVNKLHVAKLIPNRLDPELESMLAIGVDEMSWDDLDESNYKWPSLEQVKRYRERVRQVVDEFITSVPITLPIGWDDPMWIILMGIEHERIHLETSSVLIRQLSAQLVRTSDLFRDCAERGHTAPANSLLPLVGREIHLGKKRDNPLYGWDNEYGGLPVPVNAFKASRFLVSNGEFLQFVEQGGYRNRSCWTDEGWGWVKYTQAQHPQFWIPDEKGFRYRTMTQVIDMPWDWPVDVNYLEAKAFCNWKAEQTGLSIRMPTEAEWRCLREAIGTDLPDWDQAPGNINLEYWASACPVNKFKTILPGGVELYDVIGNVWQWTETPIEGFPGFEVHPVYDDFSTPTFDGKHNLIKGGSYFSTGNYAIKDSRYAFRRHFFQHAGFRYIEADSGLALMSNPYETDQQISQYLEFHYGDEYFDVPNFAKACAELSINAARASGIAGAAGHALDLGCAVGRSTFFELAKYFERVVGLDFSARFIASAVELQQTGIKRYIIKDEGELVSYKETNLSELGLDAVSERCQFMQADACNLNVKYIGYDLIFAGNLIDRLYSPKMFLSMIHERMHPDGLLILTSPYTWLLEFTERDEWLGGFKDNVGESYTTLDGLKAVLGARFELVGEPRDVPFIIRETRRKFQHTLAQMTVWKRIK